jgi:tRNA threonylcarbamoyl adenosine modification protein (Sua5/YciO/YrdC/YwlC family)
VRIRHSYELLSWEKAVSHLTEGGILIYPTDTLWGLGCRADLPTLCRACLALKGESRSSVASVILTPTMLASEVQCPPAGKALLPGPYTLVLPTVSTQWKHLCSENSQNQKSFLGCRIPDHAKLIEMVAHLDVPIITTSVNSTGKDPIIHFEEADAMAKQWKVAIVREEVSLSEASTVLKWDETSWTLLRRGSGSLPEFIKM